MQSPANPMTACRVLSSNGVPIPFYNDLFSPLQDSSSMLSDPVALRRRFQEEGYVYLRGALDRQSVMDLRSAYLSTFPSEMLKPGTSPADGIFSGRVPTGLPPHGMRGHPAYGFVRSPVFERFLSQPKLAQLAEVLLGGPPMRLRRSILRHFYQGSQRSSRAHVDAAYMDEGSLEVVTIWIPVGDCPLDTGGLIYLKDSHRMAPSDLAPARSHSDRPFDDRPISHDLEWTARSLKSRWLWADYSAGDICIHDPRIVHASLDTTTGSMRVSVDVRFALRGITTDRRWARPWSGDDGALCPGNHTSANDRRRDGANCFQRGV